jgi:hypothetical protein
MATSAAKHIAQIIQRDGPWCHYCGYEVRNRDVMSISRDAPSRDHIIPRALGGENTLCNLKLAHKYCNSVRALGFSVSPKMREKHERFIESLINRGYTRNPNYTGPANHNIAECPKYLVQGVKRASHTVFFSLGPIAFDIRYTPGKYSHVRISIGSKHLTGAGYIHDNV